MERVIITGATSMIGVALINECLKNNVEVIAISRVGSKNLNRIPISPLIRIIECDLNKIKDLENLIKDKVDCFYHFAWEYTSKKERNNSILQNENIKLTLECISIAKILGCISFVGAGSQAEYGRVDKEKISPITPCNPEIAYGIAKYSAGKLGALLAKELKIRYSWVRIFSVYGIYDNDETLISALIKKMLKNEKIELTKGEQNWDYLFSEDAGRAFYNIGKSEKEQSVYCLGSGETKKIYEYVKLIKKTINSTSEIQLGAIPYTNNQVMNLCADISTLTENTKFIPSNNFENGILKTITWIKNTQKGKI